MAGLFSLMRRVLNTKRPINGCSIGTSSGLMRNCPTRSLLVPRSKLLKTSLGPRLLDPHHKPDLQITKVDLSNMLHSGVRKQFQGDCWAMAPVQVAEGIYFRETGQRIQLSVQHLISTFPRKEGGILTIMHAIEYMQKHGIFLENNWAYDTLKPLDKYGPRVMIGDWEDICGAYEIIGAVQKGLPLIGQVKGHPAMDNYCDPDTPPKILKNLVDPLILDSSHIIAWDCERKAPTCKDKDCIHFAKENLDYCGVCGYTGEPDHAVVICGYDISRSSKYYYEYKNSYGIEWGIKGFGKMKITELGDMPPPGDPCCGVMDMENEAVALYPPKVWFKNL